MVQRVAASEQDQTAITDAAGILKDTLEIGRLEEPEDLGEALRRRPLRTLQIRA